MFRSWRKTLERGEIGREFGAKEAFVDGGDETMLGKDAEILAFSGVSRIWRDFFPTWLKKKSN